MPNITWDLLYRDRGVQKGLRDIGEESDRSARRADAWRKAAAAGFVIVAAAAVKWGADSAKAYTEAQTQQAKLTDAYARFPRLADTNISALRSLNSERMKTTRFDDDATAAAQAQLAQYKLTGQQLTELTPLIQDYAARTGKDLPTAARDAGKAVLGQGRAFKSIGLDLKDTGSKTDNYANLVKGLRTQVGGFAEKEGKSAAGQMEILKNQVGELQEVTGEKLVPILIEGAKAATGMATAVGDNADVIVPLVGTVAGLTTALWLGHKATKAYAAVQTVLQASMSSNSRIMTGLAAVASKAGPWGLAIGGGIGLLGLFAAKAGLSEKETRKFTDSLTYQGDVLDENSGQMLVKKLADEGALDAAKRAGIAESDYVRALVQGGPAREELIARLIATEDAAQANADAFNGDVGAHLDLAEAAQKAWQPLRQTGAALDASKQQADLVKTAYAGASTETDTLATKTNQLKAAQGTLNTELQKSIDKFTILREGALGQERANLAWEESVDAVRTSVKENGRSLDRHTEKGRTNRGAVINMITALNDKVTADVKNAGAVRKGESAQDAYERAQKTATTATKDGIEKIREHARRAKLNKEQVDGMIEEFLKTPSAAGKMGKSVERAANKVEDLRNEIGGLKSKGVTARVTFNAGGTRIILKPGTLGGGLTAFESGGYTGNVHPKRVVGVVHGDEEVIRSPSRRKFESKYPGFLHHINEHGDIPGYEGGGLVTVRGEAGPRPRVGAITRLIMDRIIAKIRKEATDDLEDPFAGSSGSWSGGSFGSLNSSQMGIAATIAGVGRPMGKKAQLIGIITGLVESGLRNVNFGDRDSLGVFQQRAPWGPASVRRNVRASAGMFFHGGRGGQRGLDDIGGWRSMSPGRAAQRVQVSAFPSRYGARVSQGLKILAALAGQGGGGRVDTSGPGWMGGVRPLSSGRVKRHTSGYPWANWAGDFNGPGNDYGMPVRAWKAGTVTAANNWNYSYGRHLRIRHAGGAETLYAHHSRNLVRRGQRVGAGQQVGRVGSTGNSSGDHSHWEVKGLAGGGIMRRPSIVGISERGPERVLTTQQTKSYDRLVELVSSRGAVGNVYHVTLNAPNYIGSRDELKATLVQMAGQGQLGSVLQKAGVRGR